MLIVEAVIQVVVELFSHVVLTVDGKRLQRERKEETRSIVYIIDRRGRVGESQPRSPEGLLVIHKLLFTRVLLLNRN